MGAQARQQYNARFASTALRRIYVDPNLQQALALPLGRLLVQQGPLVVALQALVFSAILLGVSPVARCGFIVRFARVGFGLKRIQALSAAQR